MVVDLFYWFDKSSKGKGKLKEYHEFCNQEYREVLKHLSVRWLSLEKCINRAVLKHISLESYFESEHFADERFQRLFSKSSMEAMGRKLATRIIKSDKLREITTLLEIDLESPEIFKHPETLYVGNY